MLSKVGLVLSGPALFVSVAIISASLFRIRFWVRPEKQADRRFPIVAVLFATFTVFITARLARAVSEEPYWAALMCWLITFFCANAAVREKRRSSDDTKASAEYLFIVMLTSLVCFMLTLVRLLDVNTPIDCVFVSAVIIVQIVYLIAARFRPTVGYCSAAYTWRIALTSISALVTLVATSVVTIRYFLR